MKLEGPYSLYDIIQEEGEDKFEITAINFDINYKLNHNLKSKTFPLGNNTIETCKERNDRQVFSLSEAIRQVKIFISEHQAGSKRIAQLDYLVNSYEHFRNWYGKNNYSFESEEGNVFKNNGDTWDISYKGIKKTIKHTKGMDYIFLLLKHQGQRLHSMEMYQLISGIMPGIDKRMSDASPERIESDEGLHVDGKDSFELIDQETIDSLKNEEMQLDYKLKQAIIKKDLVHENEYGYRLEKLRDFLSKQTYRGRSRTASDATERMRQSIFRAIDNAKKNIKNHHKELFEHLDEFLTTGIYNSYSPDGPVSWVQNP